MLCRLQCKTPIVMLVYALVAMQRCEHVRNLSGYVRTSLLTVKVERTDSLLSGAFCCDLWLICLQRERGMSSLKRQLLNEVFNAIRTWCGLYEMPMVHTRVASESRTTALMRSGNDALGDW